MAAGEVIFSEGEPGDTLYVIAEGKVEISRRPGGEKIVLAVLQRHDLFGEMALITGAPRSATARTLAATRLIPVRAATFADQIHRTRPEPTRPIVCAACGRKAVRPAEAPDTGSCLLSQGAVCLGFVTRGGCGAVCTRAGTACWGCRGLSDKALARLEAGANLSDLLVERLARLRRIAREAAADRVRRFIREGHSALSAESKPPCDGAHIRCAASPSRKPPASRATPTSALTSRTAGFRPPG